MPCPCGSRRPYGGCCEPFHDERAEPAHAAALMRARYSAFVEGRAEYLWQTLHPSHDDRDQERQTALAKLEASFAQQQFLGLTIHDERPSDGDGVALVLFQAKLRWRGRDASFVELSRFAHDGAGWRYLVGETVALRTLRGETPRIGKAPFRP